MGSAFNGSGTVIYRGENSKLIVHLNYSWHTILQTGFFYIEAALDLRVISNKVSQLTKQLKKACTYHIKNVKGSMQNSFKKW